MNAIPPQDDLRRVSERSLPLGKPLPGSLYGNAGRVIAAAGTTFSAKRQLAITRLATSVVFSNAAWPD